MKLILSLVSITIFGGMFFNIPGESPSVEIIFCQFPLSEDIKQAHASFSVSYTFRLDGEGRPKEIHKVLGTQVNDEQVTNCLSAWRFPGIATNTRLLASFTWEHGIGWTELSLTGKGVNQTIKLSGERCAYSRQKSSG